MISASHVLIGVTGWAVLADGTGAPLAPGATAVAALGSLAPDLDHPGSFAGQALRPVSLVLAALVGHRGLTHSIWAVAALVLAGLLLSGAEQALMAAFTTGYALHIGADLLTQGGVAIFAPFGPRLCLPWTVRTGDLGEALVALALVGAGGLMVSPGVLSALEAP